MRPSDVYCTWCNTSGIALAIPGSVCHECRAPWQTVFNYIPEGSVTVGDRTFQLARLNMTPDELRAACRRIGRTIDQMFGEGTERRLFTRPGTAWTIPKTNEIALARRRFEDELIRRFSADFAAEIDRQEFAHLERARRTQP